MLCNLFFGSTVHSVITLNLPGGALSDTVKLSLSIALVLTYVIQMVPVYRIMFGDEGSNDDQDEDGDIRTNDDRDATSLTRTHILAKCLLRVVPVLITGLLAFIFNNFGLIVSFVGAFSVTSMAYIVPCLVFLKVFAPSPNTPWTTRLYVIPWGIIVIGVLASITSLYTSIREAAKQ